VHGERVPCSLGYHFLIRRGKLSCRYFIRSCDFVRHFNDDVYMTARLMQWVADQLPGVECGKLLVWVGSLHCMKGDEAKIKMELQKGDSQR
jgi:thymidylate synthase